MDRQRRNYTEIDDPETSYGTSVCAISFLDVEKSEGPLQGWKHATLEENQKYADRQASGRSHRHSSHSWLQTFSFLDFPIYV